MPPFRHLEEGPEMHQLPRSLRAKLLQAKLNFHVATFRRGDGASDVYVDPWDAYYSHDSIRENWMTPPNAPSLGGDHNDQFSGDHRQRYLAF